MKKIKNILLPIAFTALFAVNVQAADINVTIDGEAVVFEDVQPVIINSRTYVPLRGVFEKLGYEISWDSSIKTATLTKGSTEISANTSNLRVSTGGAGHAIGGGNLPIITQDRFMLPIRAISEASGCVVTWDGNTKTVLIVTQDDTVSDYKNPNGRGTATEEDYIKTAYKLCDEIKETAAKSDNAALLRFLGKGHMNESAVTPSQADNARLKQIADELYALDPAPGMGDIQARFKTYADMICEYITLTENYSSGEMTEEAFTAEIDTLAERREELAINFSVALNDYFVEKNVFYEGVYGEYVLDMMK